MNRTPVADATVPDTPLPGMAQFVRHGCERHEHHCPEACDHIPSYGPAYLLYETSLGLRRVADLCAARLAELLDLKPDDVRTEFLSPPPALGDVIGLSLILDAAGPLGYHRVSYDHLRRWTYCANPKYGPWDPSCAYPFPPAPPYEAIGYAAETITYTAQYRGKKGGPIGFGDPTQGPVVCLRPEARGT